MTGGGNQQKDRSVAQKEDILEQIVEEYLTHEGYFVRHNIKYRPVEFKQTPSDPSIVPVSSIAAKRRKYRDDQALDQ